MKDMFKKWGPTNFIAALVLALILVVGGSALGTYVSNRQVSKSVAGIEDQATPAVLQTISYDGQDGKNALELLKASHKVETQDSSQGSFVTSIDQTANTDSAFWMFYVDGQLASSGADSYITKNGEKIEWKFEQFQ